MTSGKCTECEIRIDPDKPFVCCLVNCAPAAQYLRSVDATCLGHCDVALGEIYVMGEFVLLVDPAREIPFVVSGGVLARGKRVSGNILIPIQVICG
jgi:hypothetical protein